ncbi:ATPases [Acetobacter aceti NRIC 0242]|uniref:Transposase n=1 Tax=Acetobacter aceti NBRC 14818 TaxID=887700 RepID=A0AB33IJ33_ACEAC|nr:hypothetical protein EMQ_1623 [Acetobacter aceti NBRC 14818]GAN58246.1 hypothetical protein Abac_036_021 [Acetobacter aceti NBRC 14818]GBO81590.1 ATPases [Acetobacter aceti NRIC 0242]
MCGSCSYAPRRQESNGKTQFPDAGSHKKNTAARQLGSGVVEYHFNSVTQFEAYAL